MSEDATVEGYIMSKYSDVMETLDEEYHEVFTELVNTGKSPSGTAAAIEYVTTRKSQSQIASEYDVSEMTVRTLYPSVEVLLNEQATTGRKNGQRAIDFCEYIADCLDWEEGVEYTTRQAHSKQTLQPNLRTAGWQAVAEFVGEHTAVPNGGDASDD